MRTAEAWWVNGGPMLMNFDEGQSYKLQRLQFQRGRKGYKFETGFWGKVSDKTAFSKLCCGRNNV